MPFSAIIRPYRYYIQTVKYHLAEINHNFCTAEDEAMELYIISNTALYWNKQKTKLRLIGLLYDMCVYFEVRTSKYIQNSFRF